MLFFFHESAFGADIQTDAAFGAQDRVDADVLILIIIIVINQGRTLKMLDAITAAVAVIANLYRDDLTGAALARPMKRCWHSFWPIMTPSQQRR